MLSNCIDISFSFYPFALHINCCLLQLKLLMTLYLQEKHECPDCSKVFFQRTELMAHLQAFHQSHKSFTCRVCMYLSHKSFTCRVILNQSHVRCMSLVTYTTNPIRALHFGYGIYITNHTRALPVWNQSPGTLQVGYVIYIITHHRRALHVGYVLY